MILLLTEQPTIIRGAEIAHWLINPKVSLTILVSKFLSLTTTNLHGWPFDADGASMAASIILFILSSSTGISLYFLILLLFFMTSKTSIYVFLSHKDLFEKIYF